MTWNILGLRWSLPPESRLLACVPTHNFSLVGLSYGLCDGYSKTLYLLSVSYFSHNQIIYLNLLVGVLRCCFMLALNLISSDHGSELRSGLIVGHFNTVNFFLSDFRKFSSLPLNAFANCNLSSYIASGVMAYSSLSGLQPSSLNKPFHWIITLFCQDLHKIACFCYFTPKHIHL